MAASRYVLSFSAGGLLYHESVVVAEAVWRSHGDWRQAIAEVERDNLLQSRTRSTAKRKLHEVRNRLQLLTENQFRLLCDGSRQEQKLILWLACCLRYEVLADFAREVLRGKYLQMDFSLDRTDVERFLDSKSIWHEELDRLAPSTRTKLQTVMLRMLRESELLTSEGVILPQLFSDRVSRVLSEDSNEHFLLFPTATPS